MIDSKTHKNMTLELKEVSFNKGKLVAKALALVPVNEQGEAVVSSFQKAILYFKIWGIPMTNPGEEVLIANEN